MGCYGVLWGVMGCYEQPAITALLLDWGQQREP